MTKLTIKIPIDDWHDEVLRDESIVTGDDDIFKQVKEGHSTAQIARSAIVSRETGNAPEDILRPNKLLYLTGAMVDMTRKIVSQKHDVETPGGKVYESRDFVGIPGRGRNEEETPDGRTFESAAVGIPTNGNGKDFVMAASGEGLERAKGYLERVVPGYIWGRLVIVLENGGDVGEIAEMLKLKIDEMVERLD